MSETQSGFGIYAVPGNRKVSNISNFYSFDVKYGSKCQNETRTPRPTPLPPTWLMNAASRPLDFLVAKGQRANQGKLKKALKSEKKMH